MHKYRLEVTKNGVMKSAIIRTDDNWGTVWDEIWKYFHTSTHWYCYGIMVCNPDFAQLFEIQNDAEAAAAANKATA